MCNTLWSQFPLPKCNHGAKDGLNCSLYHTLQEKRNIQDCCWGYVAPIGPITITIMANCPPSSTAESGAIIIMVSILLWGLETPEFWAFFDILDCNELNVSQCQQILAETFEGVLSNSYSHFYIMSNEDYDNRCQKQAPKHKLEYVLIYI